MGGVLEPDCHFHRGIPEVARKVGFIREGSGSTFQQKYWTHEASYLCAINIWGDHAQHHLSALSQHVFH